MGERRRIITLTTDFGVRDTFVGEMKGAILSIAPEVAVVDLCHDVPRHDVAAGAFLVDVGTRAFPDDAIHVVVVDPGVGTARRAVAVETAAGVYVAPDNGVLARALARRRIVRAHALEEASYRRHGVGATFEGRDRFAPAAARIARGTPLDRLGPAVEVACGPRSRSRPLPGHTVPVAVVHVDRFGNVYLDVEHDAFDDGLEPYVLRPDGGTIDRVVRAYGDAGTDDPVLLFNSAGVLEIAVREGSASETLGIERGARLQVGCRPREQRGSGVV